MIRVEIGVVGVEIGNPWVLDYGFGWRWRWRWRWLGMVGEGWVFLGLVGVEIGGQGGRFCWRGLGFFVFGRGGWRSVVGVVVFVGEDWVFLGLIVVEIARSVVVFVLFSWPWLRLGFDQVDSVLLMVSWWWIWVCWRQIWCC